MVNPVNSNSPNNPSGFSSKPHVVADHVANKLHAERQAYLNTANDGANHGSNFPSLFRVVLSAISWPLLKALRLPFRSSKASTGSDSVSALSSPNMATTPRESLSKPRSLGRPPLHPTAGSHVSFQSALGPRAPGEEKSDSPPNSPLASVGLRPNLTLDESAFHVPTITVIFPRFQRVVRSLAEDLHQSPRSPSGLSLSSTSTTSSARSSPFSLLNPYVSPSSSEYQSSVGTPPGTSLGTPPLELPNLEQPSQQAWWENVNLPPVDEDLDSGCYCGLDLFISRLVWGDPLNPSEAHPTE